MDQPPFQDPLRDERSARLLFTLAPEMGPVHFQGLLALFGTPQAALGASAEDWAMADGFTREAARKLHAACLGARGLWEKEVRFLEGSGARVLIPSDPDFPEGLKPLHDPPIALYVQGGFRPVDALAVALVGTRRPSPYGLQAAERLSGELAQAGVTLVSGLARGIDTAVHRTALRNKTRTIGVLGSGLENFYPPENKPLREKMVLQGAVVSEFPLRFPPDKGNFPRRNRIISGLSLAVVVVEADEKSGALITARLAAEQGRDVLAVPGPIFSRGSLGPHKLLKQGARLVESAEDILDEVRAFRGLAFTPRPAAGPAAAGLTPPEEKLLGLLTPYPAGVDDIAQASGLPVAEVSPVLLKLELKGLAKALPGNCYARLLAPSERKAREN